MLRSSALDPPALLPSLEKRPELLSNDFYCPKLLLGVTVVITFCLS